MLSVLRATVLSLLLSATFHGAVAQSLSANLKTDTAKEYYVIKRLTKTASNPGFVRNLTATEDYSLGTCGERADFGKANLSGYANLARQLSELATTIVTYKTDLGDLRYPEAVWRPLLIEFEDAQLQYLKSNPDGKILGHQLQFQKSLAFALQRYRSQFDRSLPMVVDNGTGECGSGEIDVTLESDPPHARIQLISKFAYLVCRAQDIDPDTGDACDGWWDAPNPGKVSGEYKYKVTWPDGTVRIADLNMDKVEDGGTITLHRP